MPEKINVNFFLNGKEVHVQVHPMARLLDVIREIGLTGTKDGCGEGECGACAILVNGKLVNSCLVPMAQMEGTAIQTIEGVANGNTIHAIQKAFLEHGGAQCGICTPGMIMAALSLLKKNPKPTEFDIREALAGNLCRCTGYIKIFESVMRAFQNRSSTP